MTAAPIRIANCSGFYGDRLAAAREMVEGGPIDVLTGDWLAELTMLVLAKNLSRDNGAGYARTFVTQMEQVMGQCLDQGIRVVSNAGDRLGTAIRGQPAGVRHHPDPPVQALPHDLFQLRDEGPGVSGAVVPGQVLGQYQHGQLGQPVTGQHVDGPALDHLSRGGQPVAVEPAGVGDAQGVSHCDSPMTASRSPALT